MWDYSFDILCENVFNVGITIDMYYMSELYSSYSRLYDEFDQNNVVDNQTFMGMLGTAVAQVVKVLCYKSEGRSFDPSWCHWNFSLT